MNFWSRVKTYSSRRAIGFRYCADNRRESKDIDSHPVNISVSEPIKTTPFWKVPVQFICALFLFQLVVGLIVVFIKWLAGGYG